MISFEGFGYLEKKKKKNQLIVSYMSGVCCTTLNIYIELYFFDEQEWHEI